MSGAPSAAPAKRFYYVGDNRNRENWGCRATSAALGSLIASEGEIIGICDGRETANGTRTPAVYSGWMPVGVARLLGAILRRSRRLRRLRPYLGALLLDDYLSEDIDVSVRRFTRFSRRYPHLKRIYEGISGSDAVVINGEGTLILSTPPRRDVLFYLVVLELARRLGKQTYYLNAMVSDCPTSGRNQRTFETVGAVLKHCTFISTRDPQSLRMLEQMGVSGNARYIPDALFTWVEQVRRAQSRVGGSSELYAPFGAERLNGDPAVDLGGRYICVSGSSSAGGGRPQTVEAYTRLLNELSTLGLPLLVVPTCAGDRFLYDLAGEMGIARLDVKVPIKLGAAILANAQLFVSGRFHPSILASLGGTPCVFMGSNSHKTLSIQSLLGYEKPEEFPSVPSAEECARIVRRGEAHLLAGEPLRARLRERSAALAQEAESIRTIVGSHSSHVRQHPVVRCSIADQRAGSPPCL